METNDRKCAACKRSIDAELDDVKTIAGAEYHEECAPAPPPEPPAVGPEKETTMKEKKPKKSKPMSLPEQLAVLVEAVTRLSEKVEVLESGASVRPATEASKSGVARGKGEKGQPRANVWYQINNYPEKGHQPQCLLIYRAIAQACPESRRMTEVEIANVVAKVTPWPYRQTQFHIFKYYRPKMIDGGYISEPNVEI